MSAELRRPPSYCLHKSSGQARVIINGKHIYLGKYGTAESHEKYHRLVAEWLASGRVIAPSNPGLAAGGQITVNELILAFWRFAEKRYVKNGSPTSEQRSFRTALKPVRQLYGHKTVSEFGPLALVACREQLINGGICRKRINQHVGRIRQMFKWGVSRELVPETVWRALCSVPGLKVGEARETLPVRPVDEQHIAAIQPFVSPQIWAMVNIQLWTGCRPGEVCLLRGADIKMGGDIWEYVPHSHKLQHHRKQRIVYLGPHAQSMVKSWLRTDGNEYLFSPRESKDWYRSQRSTGRTKIAVKRKRRRRLIPLRAPGDHFTTHAYDHAIAHACVRAGVPHWSPNQLRHNAATRVRNAYGIEAARIILGHASAVTSEIYAEIDRERAKEIMQKLG